jgi:UDP-N-acetylmuramoyl-L-alanyl-D-glutamate--2,6-diaminopimelate ligase
MKLGQLLEGIAIYDLEGDMEQEIKGLNYDSRKIQEGDLFVAIKGHALDGHDYIDDAVRNGAVALVAEEFKDHYGGLSKVRVPNSREALSKLAARFYDNPWEGMSIIGITGTNGKTTTAYILESILSNAGAVPGVIGTINSRFKGKIFPSPVTTPESLDLMRIMREMADGGVTHVVMEVSSHALDQNRTGDCPFRTALFTNFSRDHLDYHNSMEEYFKAKSLLFRSLDQGGGDRETSAVINMDDPRGKELASISNATLLTYGLGREWDVRADNISADKNGLRAMLITPDGEAEIRSSLIGVVNIYNILAATAASLFLGIDLSAIAGGIGKLKKVPGRLELVENPKGLTVVVDYAHTPDALLKAMGTVRPITKGRLFTLFGCGGDRDKGKRYEMGLAAGKNSDIVVITSDNPRTEGPEAIVRQIEEGVKESGLTKSKFSSSKSIEAPAYFVEVDRHKAIEKTVLMANEDDLILIAGKGHEDYQIVGTKKVFFDDRYEVARAAKLPLKARTEN